MSKKKVKVPVAPVTPIVPVAPPAGNLFGKGQVITSPPPPPAPAPPPAPPVIQHDGQFTTIDQAMQVMELVNSAGLSSRIPPIDQDGDKSGIFIVVYNGPYQTPIGKGPGEYFYHLRFSNGVVMNAGLVAATITQSPTNWKQKLEAELSAK